MAQQHGMAAHLLGDDLPVGAGSEIGAYGAAGSRAAGGGGRIGLAEGLSVRVGLADIQQRYEGITQSDATLAAASLRYVAMPVSVGAVQFRPLGEIGGWLAPNLPLAFTRTYANGAGLGVGQGSTLGSMDYVYGRVGAAFALSPADDLVIGGELGREHLGGAGWSEGYSAPNPFPAQVGGIDATLLLGKLRAQWSHRFGEHLDVTLFAAGVRALGAYGPLDVSIAPLGPIATHPPGGAMWAEYGARVGWQVGPVTLDAFAGGVAGGPKTIGASLHGGGGLRMAF
jgi:hypothetical protein